MTAHQPKYEVRLASSPDEVQQAQQLRYKVFVRELGGEGPLVDHDLMIERDRFDKYCDHLLLFDVSAAEAKPVVGAYRLLNQAQATKAGQFYSEAEYDLGVLRASGRKVLELGRTCVDPEHRNGVALFHLWRALATYVEEQQIEILFGVASFHGANIAKLAQPLALLYQNHLAPPDLRVRARAPHYCPMDTLKPTVLNRREAMLQIPPLIKAYLKLGGCVGDGAYVDHAFNTTDVCLLVDTAKMNARQKALYAQSARGSL